MTLSKFVILELCSNRKAKFDTLSSEIKSIAYLYISFSSLTVLKNVGSLYSVCIIIVSSIAEDLQPSRSPRGFVSISSSSILNLTILPDSASSFFIFVLLLIISLENNGFLNLNSPSS